MEQRLRVALDSVQFEHPVVRADAGVYSFGSDVKAVVKMTQNGDVVASKDGHTFKTIEDFVQHLSEEIRQNGGVTIPEESESSETPQASLARLTAMPGGSNFGSGTYLSADGSLELLDGEPVDNPTQSTHTGLGIRQSTAPTCAVAGRPQSPRKLPPTFPAQRHPVPQADRPMNAAGAQSVAQRLGGSPGSTVLSARQFGARTVGKPMTPVPALLGQR
jgi:hypothetical protein